MKWVGSFKTILFKNGLFSYSFFFIFVFSIPSTVNVQNKISTDDWIWTADIWSLKRPLYQLSNNTVHSSFTNLFLQKYSLPAARWPLQVRHRTACTWPSRPARPSSATGPALRCEWKCRGTWQSNPRKKISAMSRRLAEQFGRYLEGLHLRPCLSEPLWVWSSVKIVRYFGLKIEREGCNVA